MFSRVRVVAVTIATLLLASFAPQAQAAAPSAPVLVSPADNATAASTDVPLAVTASDPDGGSVSVRFEGRKKGATVPGGGGGTPFTLVALPDTQNYTYNNRQGTMNQQSQWVLNNRNQLNTAMVVQLGDLVSEEENANQWGLTSAAFKIMDDANMPNTVVAGNHDFNIDTGDATEYNTWFGPSRYVGKQWTPNSASYGGYLGQNLFGPDPVNRGNMDNFALFSAGGRDFLVLNLEWEAPSYALDWARKVLAAYPNRIAIMATHGFVNINGQRKTVAERPGGTPANTLWNDFVAQQCSIKLVLNGHFHNGDLSEANRSDLNSCGQPVQQILTDYQDRPNGGDGWLRYYTFNPAANTMTATTYSPKLNLYETDADSSFTLPFELSQAQPAPFTTIATVQVNSGQTATTTWTGRDPDTAYEWRAVAVDGTDSATSATWTVRTPANTDYVDDTFTRNVTNGWGAPDAGHAWQLNSSLTSFSVDGAVGKVTVPAGSGRGGSMTGVSATDVRVSTDLSMAQLGTGSGTYVSLMARANGTTSYRSKLRYLNGTLTLTVGRTVNGTETTFATATVAGVTATPGLPLRFKLETEGTSPTTVRAKVWPSAAAEPGAWTVTGTDSTVALQSAGTVGLDLYVSGSATAPSALSFDRFTASRLGATPPANVKPTAAIGTPNISGLSVSFSGAGSTDTDGTIAGYSWNYGDNTAAGTGATPSHTYAAGGTYTVTLTVTDDDGATDTTTRQVTVSSVNLTPTAVIGNPTINELAVTLNGADSTDPDGAITGYSWNYGDNTATGTGVTTNHTYAAGGTYTVTLTVTDDEGATDSATRQVTVDRSGCQREADRGDRHPDDQRSGGVVQCERLDRHRRHHHRIQLELRRQHRRRHRRHHEPHLRRGRHLHRHPDRHRRRRRHRHRHPHGHRQYGSAGQREAHRGDRHPDHHRAHGEPLRCRLDRHRRHDRRLQLELRRQHRRRHRRHPEPHLRRGRHLHRHPDRHRRRRCHRLRHPVDHGHRPADRDRAGPGRLHPNRQQRLGFGRCRRRLDVQRHHEPVLGGGW